MSGRAWTSEDIAILRFQWGERNIKYLCKKLSRTPTALKDKALKLRLGSPNHGYYKIGALIKTTGYSRSRLLNAMQQLRIRKEVCFTSDTRMLSRPSRTKHTRVSEESRDKILAFLATIPDGKKLFGTKKLKTMKGMWGQGIKPKSCNHCDRQDRPHHALGLCHPCHELLVRGAWSLGGKPARCTGCNRNDIPHKCQGLCRNCYRMKFYIRKPRVYKRAA